MTSQRMSHKKYSDQGSHDMTRIFIPHLRAIAELMQNQLENARNAEIQVQVSSEPQMSRILAQVTPSLNTTQITHPELNSAITCHLTRLVWIAADLNIESRSDRRILGIYITSPIP